MSATFRKVEPRAGLERGDRLNGVAFRYFEGDWDSLPGFSSLAFVKEGTLPNFRFDPRTDQEHFGFEYRGYIDVPTTGVYTLHTESDDGSRLFVGDDLVVENDGLHGMSRRGAVVALSAGLHPIRVEYFEKSGGDGLRVLWEGEGLARSEIPPGALFRDR